MSVEVGVRELRDHLSRWLEQVKAGEEVIVTERGKPVARLQRVDRPPWLQELYDRGVITPAKHPKTRARPPRVKGRGSISELIDRRR